MQTVKVIKLFFMVIKEDVEKCSKFLQQKIKDLYSVEIEISKRLSPLLIGKGGANIQRLREQMPDVSC